MTNTKYAYVQEESGGLLLGKSVLDRTRQTTDLHGGRRGVVTFGVPDKDDQGSNVIRRYIENSFKRYYGDSHLITIAPTGAGKGRSVIIPNLIDYDGPVIVIDPKGENYDVTATERRKKGHKVIRLDPFRTVRDSEPDSFNPFDILKFVDDDNVADEARALVDLVVVRSSSREPFWENMAESLLCSLAIYTAERAGEEARSFSTLRDIVFSPDITVDISKIIRACTDKNGHIPEYLYELKSFTKINNVTKSSILAFAQSFLTIFGSNNIRRSVSSTTFDLEDLINGEKISIYIIIPPNKLISHRSLLRLWTGSLIALFATRQNVPEKRTLFLLDEVAQLGYMAAIETAMTLMRGYGLQVWTFWQDLSQIVNLYPTTHQTIINNCDVVQLFGAKNRNVMTDFSKIIGVGVKEVIKVTNDEQILMISGDDPICARRFDYLSDPHFQNKFSQNRFFKQKS